MSESTHLQIYFGAGTCKPFVKLSGLGTRINTPQTRDLISRLNLAAITVLNNKHDVLPLHPDLKEAAILNVGKPEEIEPFDPQMKRYTSFARFELRKDLPEAEQQKLRDSLCRLPACYRYCDRAAPCSLSVVFRQVCSGISCNICILYAS